MNGRIRSVDMVRGLIMMFMALDHFIYFINRFHPAEYWILAPPVFPSPAYAVFRFISHLCAPGFVFLAGTSLVLFAERRGTQGWEQPRIRRSLAIRGTVLLLIVQVVLETGAWSLGDLGGRGVALNAVRYPGVTSVGPVVYLGVIYALALSFILGSLLYRLPKTLLAVTAGLSLVSSPVVLSYFLSASVVIPPALNVLFVPGVSLFFTNYPLFPWFGVFLLGMLLGRVITENGPAILSQLWCPGLVVLVAGIAVRFVHPWGEFHRFDPSRPWSFFELSKYPPSPAFLGITVGIVLVLLCLFRMVEQRQATNRATKLTEIFGREPLLFYLLHLYAYAGVSFLVVFTNRPILTLVGWLVSLACFAPILFGFRRLRATARLPWILSWL